MDSFIEGAPVEMIQPGFGAIMIEVEQKEYVSGQTILTANSTVQGFANAWWMNVTDDATLNHTSPVQSTYRCWCWSDDVH